MLSSVLSNSFASLSRSFCRSAADYVWDSTKGSSGLVAQIGLTILPCGRSPLLLITTSVYLTYDYVLGL